MPNLTINGQSYFADAPPDSPLLWVIREDLRLTGTKYGCGIGLCGCCTVHVNGHEVPQCGYCQSGQIMQAAALLADNPSPSEREIVDGMNGNLCRCATYPRIV